jgi:hypothetical protein
VHVAGGYAYVADGDSGLQVIEKFLPLTEIQYVDSGTLIATVPAGYRPDTYNLHVTNPDGGHTVLHNAFTSFENEVGIKMALPARWSMISLPVRPDVPTVAAVFPDAVVVYRYQKGTGYVRVTGGENLEVGVGYWILLNSPQLYVITGTPITEYTMPIADGWYMIGGCTDPGQKMVTSGSIDVIYEYTQGSGYIRVPGSQPLERGKGYWILFSDTSGGAAFTARTSMAIGDLDGDGIPDRLESCPNDPNKIEPGVCGCGVADIDSDGDGVLDCNDGCPNDPNKIDTGACGCSMPEIDWDADGTPDCVDGCPNDPNKVHPGYCGCGVPEIDADGNGVIDCMEEEVCPNDPYKTYPGVCGCGVPDIDSDGDGALDCNDECPNDPNKVDPGICGCGVADTDSDGDGTLDCD